MQRIFALHVDLSELCYAEREHSPAAHYVSGEAGRTLNSLLNYLDGMLVWITICGQARNAMKRAAYEAQLKSEMEMRKQAAEAKKV